MKTGTSDKQFDAFISYSGPRTVPWLVYLRLSLIGASFWRFSRWWGLRIFFDRKHIRIGDSLPGSISDAIQKSKYFILLASKTAAESLWVSKEVDLWLQTNSVSRILIVVLDGTIEWDHEHNDFDWSVTDCLPVILKGRYSQECCWEDLREATSEPPDKKKMRDVVESLAAKLLEVPKEKIISDETRRQRRLWKGAVTAVLAVIMLSLFAIYSWRRIETPADSNYKEARTILAGRRDWQTILAAIGKLEQSLKSNPRHIPSLITLADAHLLCMGFGGPGDRQQHFRQAADALLQAEKYGGDDSSEYYRVKGRFRLYNDWEILAARDLLQKAVDADSKNVDALYALASTYTFLDDHQPAIQLCKRAIEIVRERYGQNDERFIHAQGQLAWTYLYAGQNDRAIDLSRKILKHATSPAASRVLAHAFSVTGNYKASVIAYLMATNQDPSQPLGVLKEYREPNLYPNYLCALVKSGEMQLGEALLEMQNLQANAKQVSPYRMAQGYACMGQTNPALEQLKRARDIHDLFVIWARVDPLLLNLRGNSQFQDYLSSVGLVPSPSSPGPAIGESAKLSQ